MALFGPINQGDLPITGVAQALRFGSLLVDKTANFTMGTKEAGIFNITSGTLTATLPAANSSDLRVGDTFMLINGGAGVATIDQNTSGSLGSGIPAGITALITLTGTTDANGSWSLVLLNQSSTGITKFTSTFNADVSPTASASWSAAAAGAHTATFNPSGLVSTTPVVQVLDSNKKIVNVEVQVNSISSVVMRVPVYSGATSTFAGTIEIF